MLIALCVLFFGSMLVAGVLRVTGWQPATTRNHGQMLTPPGDLRALTPQLRSGEAYPWQPQQRLWRMVVAPAADCGQSCIELAESLDTVWRLLGHNADRLHLLWLGEAPTGLPALPELRLLRDDPALRKGLPGLDAQGENAVYVIDPNGFVIMRYAPGFDPTGLRADLAKLLKLM